MNFSEALGYSLKGQNIPKILTIALVSIIVGISVFVAGLALQSFWVLLLIFPILLVYGLFVQGYTISVIKSVMDGEDTMPAFALGRDLGRGAIMLIASIVYAIPIILFFVCGFMLLGFFSSTMSDASTEQVGLTALLPFCAMGLFSIFVIFVVNFSLIVGQVRYAAEDSAGALFDMGKNFSIVMSNLGITIGLLVRVFGVGIIFAIFSSILLNIISAFFSGVSNQVFYALQYNNLDSIANLGMPLALFASLYYTVSLTLNLMQNFSAAHLIAGYGAELGFAANKLKNDERSSGMTTVMVIFAIVILLGLVACGAIVVLALLGPAIGNVFSEVIQGLE